VATYWQWRSKHPENKLLYYVCGVEYSLVQEVKDALLAHWSHANIIKLDCKSSDWADVEHWILVEAEGLKLVCLENAQLLKPHQWERLAEYAWRIADMSLALTILVVVTNEEKPETAEARFRPFVEKGRFVECKQLSIDGLKRYCEDDYQCLPDAADRLLELCSYNFRKVNNELEKLRLLKLSPITPADVEKYVVFSADDLLVRYLLNRQSELAAKVAHVIPTSGCQSVMTYLTKKLSFIYVSMLNDAPGIGAHRLAARVGVQPWQLLEYFEVKRNWSLSLLEDKLRVLCQLEAMYAQNPTNVLQLLVRWW
jgi:DNA polymerase III delta subunit